MKITNVLGVVAVKDMQSSRKWYANLLGREADRSPMPEATEWRLPREGWIQLVQSPDKAGTSMLTLNVDDLDADARELAGRGIKVHRIDAGGRFKVATVVDPDGNQVTLAEDLTAGS